MAGDRYGDLESLANLKIARTTDRLAQENAERTNKIDADFAARGLSRSGPLDAARLRSRLKMAEEVCQEVCSIWLDLILKRDGVLTEDGVNVIMAKVQATADGLLRHTPQSSMNPAPEGLIRALNQQFTRDIEGMVSSIRRDLEIRRREQALVPSEEEAPPRAATAPEREPTAERGLLVVISHSSRDKLLAEALITLLRSGLGLAASQIRCSSVDGYRLPAGVNTDDQLRAEITTAKVLIGLLTPNSLSSTYVLFELGARWGAKLFMIPLLAGMKPEEIRGPIGASNALSCETEGQLIQVVEDTGRELGIVPESAASYLNQASAVKALSQSSVPLPGARNAVEGEKQTPAASSRDFRMQVKAGGTPPSQVLKVTSNRPVSVSQLEYMLSDQTCIVAEDVSLEGESIEVPLNHEVLTRLFNMNPSDRPTPVKFGLTVSVSGETQQYILPARMENALFGNTMYRNIIGSAQYHGIG